MLIAMTKISQDTSGMPRKRLMSFDSLVACLIIGNALRKMQLVYHMVSVANAKMDGEGPIAMCHYARIAFMERVLMKMSVFVSLNIKATGAMKRYAIDAFMEYALIRISANAFMAMKELLAKRRSLILCVFMECQLGKMNVNVIQDTKGDYVK